MCTCGHMCHSAGMAARGQFFPSYRWVSGMILVASLSSKCLYPLSHLFVYLYYLIKITHISICYEHISIIVFTYLFIYTESHFVTLIGLKFTM